MRYYTHIGTGNYHSKTSRIYTDYGLFTSDKELGEDVRKVFVQLTSLGKVSKLNKLLQSPFTLHSSLIKKIDREAEHARKGKPARIVVKVNSIDEPQLIQALYRASIARVKINLIVRGVCCVRPGVPGISENIEVRSIIGRFLEHSRIYSFENGGEPEVYGASADFMRRNMSRRVESCFPIEGKKLVDRIRSDLELYLRDNCQAWRLSSDGSYTKVQRLADEPIVSAQFSLLEQLADTV